MDMNLLLDMLNSMPEASEDELESAGVISEKKSKSKTKRAKKEYTPEELEKRKAKKEATNEKNKIVAEWREKQSYIEAARRKKAFENFPNNVSPEMKQAITEYRTMREDIRQALEAEFNKAMVKGDATQDYTDAYVVFRKLVDLGVIYRDDYRLEKKGRKAFIGQYSSTNTPKNTTVVPAFKPFKDIRGYEINTIYSPAYCCGDEVVNPEWIGIPLIKNLRFYGISNSNHVANVREMARWGRRKECGMEADIIFHGSDWKISTHCTNEPNQAARMAESACKILNSQGVYVNMADYSLACYEGYYRILELVERKFNYLIGYAIVVPKQTEKGIEPEIQLVINWNVALEHFVSVNGLLESVLKYFRDAGNTVTYSEFARSKAFEKQVALIHRNNDIDLMYEKAEAHKCESAFINVPVDKYSETHLA